jgi:hypothetical protein
MKFEIKEETIDKIVDGVEGKETTVYRVYEDGTEEVACSFWKPEETGPVEPEISQLDRIEEQVTAIASGTTAENTDAINALLGV